MAVRGKGRDGLRCEPQGVFEKVSTRHESLDDLEYGFVYHGFVEYEDEKLFLDDIKESLSSQTLVVMRDYYTDLAGGTWETNRSGKGTKRSVKDFCEKCLYGDNDCEIATSFAYATELYLTLEKIQRCPQCGGELTKYSKKQMKKLRLYDVRLKGHPAVLVVENDWIWKCKKCVPTISGVRIPTLQGTKHGKFTLRLLQSIYEKKIDGERSSVIAEAYGVRINTINKLAKEYSKHVEKTHEVGLKRKLSVGGILQKEKIRLQGRDYWAIIDVESDTLLAILTDGKVRQVDALLCGDTLVRVSDCSMALACTFDGLYPARHWLAVEVFELIQLAMEDGLDSAVQNMRELVGKIVFSERMSNDDLQDWMIACRWHNRNEKNEKTMELYQRCESIILNNPHSKDMGYGDGYCINDNMYRDTKKTLRHFMWYRDEPRYKTKDYSEFLSLVQTASKHSDFAVTEQIARMLWFNEPSMYAVGPEDGFILDIDGLPDLDFTRVGEGMPIKCLEYLLRNKLLEHRDEAIPCLRHGTYQTNKRGGCPISDCPIWRR